MSGRTPKRVHIAQIDKNSPANAQVNKAGTGPLIGQGFFFNLYSSRVPIVKATVAAALVFAWEQQAKLNASVATNNDNFGRSVSIYGDTAIVGGYNQGGGSGKVYVFTRSGTTWTQKISTTEGGVNFFGWSVSIYGNTAIVGAYLDSSSKGKAYILTTDNNWTTTTSTELIAPDGIAGDRFGYSVSIYGDTAIIGASKGDKDATANTGAAYIFTYDGSNWTYQAKLNADDATTNDAFGYSVSIYGDSAIVGAVSDDSSIGSAYVFTRSGTTWTQQEKLNADDAADGDNFGHSVSIYGDSAIIGAWGDDDPNLSGAAYIFTRSGTTWTQQAKIKADDATDSVDKFGHSVSIYEDTAIIGAINNNSAYVFTRSGTTWTQKKKLIADDVVGNVQFGESVSIYGDTAIIGASKGDKDATENTGAAYVFNYTSQ